ncbi:MAG: DNA recombination protein RmuC [Kiloniellales bacterium]
MDSGLVIALAVALVAAAVVVVILWRGRPPPETSALARATERLGTQQAELAGRLAQLAESQAANQSQLSRTLDSRLADVAKRVGDALNEQSARSQSALGDLKERLAVIDRAQQNITKLSTQVVGLQDILSNKQARGAFGEIQLNDLVRDHLPPSAYEFQATLSTGKRVDCLLKLPNPPGAIGIDAKFPLESYHALREATDDKERNLARRTFGGDISKHVQDISERYIVPGETAESALMFLPSEAVYAELHAELPEIVNQSYQRRVWIVSPTTLMAVLTTIRAVMKDVQMREQADLIQVEVQKMLQDVRRLDTRVGKLQQHFDQATEDMRQIRISTEKVDKRAERIDEIQLGEEQAVPEQPTPVRLKADGD